MQVTSLDIVVKPTGEERDTDETRLDASWAIDRLSDHLRDNAKVSLNGIAYLTPERYPASDEGCLITGAFGFGLILDRAMELSPELIQEYINVVEGALVINLEIDRNVGGTIRTQDNTNINAWNYFPTDVQSKPKQEESYVQAIIDLEGMGYLVNQQKALYEIADEICLPSFTKDFPADDQEISIPTWLEHEGSGPLKSFTPKYGDQGPIIQLRKWFKGDYDPYMERQIRDFYDEVKATSLETGIQETTSALQVAARRNAWLEERGVDLVDAVKNSAVADNGLFGPKLSVKYQMIKTEPIGSMLITSN